MNQIINDNNNNKSNNYKKVFSIPLMAIILPSLIIILLIVLSFNIYAKTNDTVESNEEQTIFAKNTSIIDDNTTEDNSITYSNNENAEEIQEKILEEQSTNNNTATKEILYTANNGETYSIIGKLNIPSLNIEYPILSSTSTELLKISLTRYWGAYPNEVGNMVVTGHNYKNNKFFGNLQKIQIGDIVKITDTTGQTLDYSVYDTNIIDPYDNSCTSQLTDGHTEITLITCYYENGSAHATKRFVVKARAY